MPAKLKRQEFLFHFATVGYVVWMVNITIAAPFDIFDIGTKRDGLPELLLYGFIPSLLALIFLNFYKEGKKNISLVFLFVIISFILEYFTTKSGIMTSGIWKPWYSIPVFFIAYYFYLPWQLKFLRTFGATN